MAATAGWHEQGRVPQWRYVRGTQAARRQWFDRGTPVLSATLAAFAFAIAIAIATAPAAMAQSTGLAVCDELFLKWEGCLTRMPDFDRKLQKSIVDELRRSVGEKVKKDLRELAEFTCRTAAQQFAGMVQPYGCTLGAAPRRGK